MHFMFLDYFVSYLSKYYWLFAENQKGNILHELSYFFMLRRIKAYITSKKMEEIILKIIKKQKKKKNSYRIRTLNLPFVKNYLAILCAMYN